MAIIRFNLCHAVTSKWEGGWSNHAADPGGKTMYGVTQAVYDAHRKSYNSPQRSVRKITHEEATSIFYHNYWLQSGSNKLVPGVDLAVYDASVMSGVSRGKRWLRTSLDPNNNHVQTVKNICAKRLGFVQSLKIWKTFGKGWARRIADVQAKGVAMAIENMAPNASAPSRAQRLNVESLAQLKKSLIKKGSGVGATTATGAGASDVAVNPEHVEQVAGWVLTSGVVVAALVIVWLFWRARVHRIQADAYEFEAGAVS